MHEVIALPYESRVEALTLRRTACVGLTESTVGTTFNARHPNTPAE